MGNRVIAFLPEIPAGRLNLGEELLACRLIAPPPPSAGGAGIVSVGHALLCIQSHGGEDDILPAGAFLVAPAFD